MVKWETVTSEFIQYERVGESRPDQNAFKKKTKKKHNNNTWTRALTDAQKCANNRRRWRWATPTATAAVGDTGRTVVVLARAEPSLYSVRNNIISTIIARRAFASRRSFHGTGNDIFRPMFGSDGRIGDILLMLPITRAAFIRG
jgi:hypothetical protein